ncbi:MAG: ATP-binding protein [Roseiflexaceae bacterium]|nr:ATP-binding protein [Roseiflexaceae bacterium]
MTDTSFLSLFTLLVDHVSDRIAPIQTTKATLVDVSHLLEDLVLSERLPAVIFTGFQESSYWRAETARYRALANVAHQICIFAGGTLPIEDDQREIRVRLRGPDPLRQEWFLLVLTESFAALLCGRDAQTVAANEAERTFETLWSFEPAIIMTALTLLQTVVAHERPDRSDDLAIAIQRFPPPQPDARLMTLFTARLVNNLTRQHQARLRLERTLAYESRLRTLGQVISGVAHELNNPLQSVLGFADLLLEDPTLAKAHDDLANIVSAAERARDIVQNLLQMSRPMADAMQSTDLGTLIQQTLIFVQADLNANQTALHIAVEPNLPLARINLNRMQQLLINLLINAIQALEHWPQPRQIRIDLAQGDQQMLVLTISDNGPGIPSELHDRIFEPFFTTKPVGKGTGLGLSIVRTIITEHQGVLTLFSQPGRGAQFIIQLPSTQPTPTNTPAVVSPVSRGHILVVDDDMQIRRLIERLLTHDGYRVQGAANGTVALELLAQNRFDAIISDVLMPDMDGMTFHEQLHHRSSELVTRLLFITGDATRPVTRAFFQRTGAIYLLKPFTPTALRAALQQVLQLGIT